MTTKQQAEAPLATISCYKMKQALNRMFRRLQTDSVTELRQISEFARLAFSYNGILLCAVPVVTLTDLIIKMR